jgi:predicted dehydrogenase
LRTEEAEDVRQLATSTDLLYVVNLMQRYNPLYHAVKQLIQDNVLGSFLHGFFENYASDEFLGPDHWFWDKQKSGGIFIEHAVHFFDMFAGWLGKGNIIAAQQLYRPGYPGVCDKVQAIARYGDALVNFYHGFDQPKSMDRQEMRLLFERGEITLYEWVPTRLKMTALCTNDTIAQLRNIFPGAHIHHVEALDVPNTVKGRFKDITYQYKTELTTRDDVQKESLYQYLVTSMFSDQVAWIRDHSHQRVITSDNAVESVRMAVSAEAMSP